MATTFIILGLIYLLSVIIIFGILINNYYSIYKHEDKTFVDCIEYLDENYYVYALIIPLINTLLLLVLSVITIRYLIKK